MSLIETISSLYGNSGSFQLTNLLSFEQDQVVDALAEEFDSMIRGNSRKNSEVIGSLMKPGLVNLDDLH